MTREEFDQHRKAINPDSRKNPTEEEYKVIEYVYTFRPSISETEGKAQIAYLYETFGMAIIRDMKPRAKLMEKKEAELRLVRQEMEKIKAEIEELREGGGI